MRRSDLFGTLPLPEQGRDDWREEDDLKDHDPKDHHHNKPPIRALVGLLALASGPLELLVVWVRHGDTWPFNLT